MKWRQRKREGGERESEWVRERMRERESERERERDKKYIFKCLLLHCYFIRQKWAKDQTFYLPSSCLETVLKMYLNVFWNSSLFFVINVLISFFVVFQAWSTIKQLLKGKNQIYLSHNCFGAIHPIDLNWKRINLDIFFVSRELKDQHIIWRVTWFHRKW